MFDSDVGAEDGDAGERDLDDYEGQESVDDDDASSAERLKVARRKFQKSIDHDAESKGEAHRALRFYANSELNGQWESEDLAYLLDQGRPAFTFNIIATKVDSFLGFYADAQRKPMVSSTGAEDQLLAEVLNITVENMLEKANYERMSARQLRTGSVAGECGMHVEVEPSPKGTGWVKVNLYRILPFEMHWDAASIEPDRSDARHVFWDRWLDEDEFKESYPDSADAWKASAGTGDPWSGDPESDQWSEDGVNTVREDDYNSRDMSRYYYDRHESKIRVIRYEYKTFVDQYTLTDTQSGESQQIEEDQVEQVQLAIEMGHPLEIEEQKVEVVKVMEFVGTSILEEFDTAGPFDGFSIVSYTYAMDEETGTTYGIVRNLFDPQMELNKAKSLLIEHDAQAITVGSIAEEGAITNEDQYAEAVRTPGATAFVKRDMLAENRVRDRIPSAPNPSATARLQSSVELLNEISGIPSTANISPGEAAQAGITVAIRYNKARQSVSQPFGNFEDSQKQIVKMMVQIITRAMPDDQIMSILSADTRYSVGNGMVVELQPAPDGSGQMVPKARAELRDIRSIDNDIEMEHGTENTTLRMLEFEALERLQVAGVPVDPEVLVERATTSRSTQERLKNYVEESQRSSEQAQQQSQQMAQQQRQEDISLQREQMQSIVQAEMAKVAQKAETDQFDAMLKLGKQETDAAQGWAALWEKADNDEKDRLVQWMKLNEARMSAQPGGQYVG